MKKFTIPCQFGNKKAPFDVYIGMPHSSFHPLYFQTLWLTEKRGGKIPGEVFESFQKLLDLAKNNNVSFEELCVYALEAANEEKKKIELSKLSAEEQDLNALRDLQKANETSLLATAGQLKYVLDENFNLLFVVCKDQLGTVYHAILLVKEDKTAFVRQLVENEKIVLHQLNQYGFVEYIGKGPDLDVQADKNIRAKYKF